MTVASILRSLPATIRADGRIVLAHILSCSKEALIMHPERALTASEQHAWEEALSQLNNAVPVPYITGTQEFWGRPFHVTPATLIPRPDTETLIESVLDLAKAHPPKRILDMGTGSGCIAISLALELPQTEVWALDISTDALTIAQQNAKTLGAKVSFFHSSWFDALPPHNGFDFIVSNPPYIEAHDEHLSNLRHEPISALTDGSTGLTAIEAILDCFDQHLNPGGFLVIEHGYDQGLAVRTRFNQKGLSNVKTIRDLGKQERITIGQKDV